jgi:ubiquinone/menaquinone biosynthesis C-methylase UbiE
MDTHQEQPKYDRPEIVEEYAQQSHLQPPEEAILRLLASWLPQFRMLDMGVGGGRTTLHFAKWVREYIGADYSQAMIAQCKKRFSGYPHEISFQACDARNMEVFDSGSFDFILFSYNGLDDLGHEPRLNFFREVRRIGRSGGFFCFSSHNLNSCAAFFEWQRLISMRPGVAFRAAKRLVRRFISNRHLKAADVKLAPYILLNVSGHTPQYHIRPTEQIAQLRDGFTGVRVFSLQGNELKVSEIDRSEDAWLYYLCEIR